MEIKEQYEKHKSLLEDVFFSIIKGKIKVKED